MKHDSAGYSLIELLVSLAIVVVISTGMASMMIQSSKVNRAQQLTADVQSNARNSMTMVVTRLRSAGWDPLNIGLPTLTLDPDLGDDISQIEVFADLNEDGETDNVVTDDDDNEQVLIRHNGGKLEWRSKSNGAFTTLSVNISNDADGDGTIEPMFVADDPVNPKRISVTITAQSPRVDPISKDFIRYTVSTDVVLRSAL